MDKLMETIISQLPGKIFRLRKGVTITAIDTVILALPKALFAGGKSISTVVDADERMNIAIHPDSENVLFYLQPGMSLTLKRSSESYIVAKDDHPRRMQIKWQERRSTNSR